MKSEKYSRTKDTTLMPREPIMLGHKATARENLVAVLRNIRNRRLVTNPDATRAHELVKKGDAEPEIRNPIDSLRNTINKGVETLRHLKRNRTKQTFRKIIENVSSELKRQKGNQI